LFANDLLHELDVHAESDLLEDLLPGDWDVQVENGRLIIQKQLMMNFADYDDIVAKVSRKAKVPESAVRNYVTRDFMYDHMMEMVQYDLEDESVFTLVGGERDHLYVRVPLAKSSWFLVRPTAFARELKALATDRGLIQYVGDETDPDELEELVYQYLNPASDNWAWRKTVDIDPKVATDYKKWAGWIAAYEKDWAKPNRWVDDIIANEYWETSASKGSPKRSAAVRRSVIRALLRNKRPDLANVVAGVQTRAVSDVDVRGGAKASTRVSAGSWQDKAKAELEAELGGIETEDTGRTSLRDAITLESTSGRADNGESEWIVFKDWKSAERSAVEYVQEMLDDDPSMFDQNFLKRHVYVSPTDIRLIANEEADRYAEDIAYESEERLLDEAGMLAKYQGMEKKIEQLEAKIEANPAKAAQLQAQVDKLAKMKEQMAYKAADKVRDDYGKQIAKQLKDDPMEWAEELGYDFGRNRPNWIQIDTRKAAQDAVNIDGVAHFLDGYDGEEVELDSGAVAFGTN
jgi:FtsZ-binding cell division protein ZapB